MHEIKKNADPSDTAAMAAVSLVPVTRGHSPPCR